MPFVESKQMALAPYAKELKQIVFGHGPFGAALKAKPLRFVELRQHGPGPVRKRALCLAQTNRFWTRPPSFVKAK